MAVWKNKYIGANKFSRPKSKLKSVKKIVMHWTANYGATANGHYNYFNNLSGRYASAHIFVDKVEALCIIPLNEIAYHANDVQRKNANGTPFRGISALTPDANYLSIGVEMCVEKDGTFHEKTIAKSVEVVAELCKRYGLDPQKDVVRHYDITRKSCPAPWVNSPAKFTKFKNDVSTKLGKKKATVPATTTPKKTTASTPKKTSYPTVKKDVKFNSYAKILQQLLIKKGYKISADGYFGDKTLIAVKAFQKKSGLSADGIVGPKTWAKLT